MESILSGLDGKENDAIGDFDALYDTKAFRILRVLIPFFPASYQPLLAVWLRFSQLQYALSLLKQHPPSADPKNRGFSFFAKPELLFSRLKPCLSPEECREMERMQNMMSMYQRFRQLEPYLSMLNGQAEDWSTADLLSLFSKLQGMSADNESGSVRAAEHTGDSREDTESAQSGVFPQREHSAQNGQPADTSYTDDTDNAADTDSLNHTDSRSSTEETGSSGFMQSDTMSTILDLMTLFRSETDQSAAQENGPERKE